MLIINPNYLLRQFNLPKEQWDESFRLAVEEKAKRNQRAIRETERAIEEGLGKLGQKVLEETPKEKERIIKETFNRYVKIIGLSRRQLRGKRLLDLGCAEGSFVKYLIYHRITQDAYGLDDNLKEFAIPDDLKDHFFNHDFQKKLPANNFDYIVSVGAVSNAIWAGKEMQQVEKIIKNSLMAIKRKGEVRISPIQQTKADSELIGFKTTFKKWTAILEKMSKRGETEYCLEPRDIKVMGKDNDIVLESVLIIKKR